MNTTMVFWLLVTVQMVAGAALSTFNATTDDIYFILWTRRNPGDDQYYTLVLEDAENLAASPFSFSDPTMVLVHGYTSNGLSGWILKARTELLSPGPYNVISVDWEALAGSPLYFEAVSNTQLVGEHTARFLEWLQAAAGLDVTQVQVTGHSLGAQVCGAIGQHLEAFRLPLITGLDPAGPLFYNVTSEHRLDASDAEFVQVIHTEGCSILTTCLGLFKESGHVDFYPNGGKHQPGCSLIPLTQGETRGCSHGLSADYWVESINGDTPFLARPCIDWEAFEAGECDTCGQGCLEMGFHVQKDLTGTYYLRTNSVSPYAMG